MSTLGFLYWLLTDLSTKDKILWSCIGIFVGTLFVYRFIYF